MQPPSGVARLLTGSLLIITLLAPTLSRPGYTTPAGDTFNILTLVPYAANFNIVSAITHHGNERLFVAELIGQIRVVTSSGYILPTPFLDITGRVSSAAGEQGLLGLVFHPDPDRSHFYLLYTNLTGDATLSRFQVSASDPNLADPNSELIMLTVPQPTPLHNGGALAFGPDGYLYVGLGDGGRDGDPDLFSQDPNNLLGTILRLDVDSSLPYAIPPDNPFVGNPAGRDEVWAYGLRNPWRFSFNPFNGDLLLTDVGQSAYEELNLHQAGSPAGQNFGWRCFEGPSIFNPAGCDLFANYTFPTFTYTHADGCAIIGGYVYNGSLMPGRAGHYFFADHCRGTIWELVPEAGGQWRVAQRLNSPIPWNTLGQDSQGEILLGGFNDFLYRLETRTVTLPRHHFLPLIRQP